MKPLNVFLALLLVLALVFLGFFYFGGQLQPSVSRISAQASEHLDAFASIRSVILSDAAPQVFSSERLDGPEGYQLIDVNLTLTNRGIFDAEWLNISVHGAAGDVAVYSLSGQGADVAARSASAVNFKLITRASADTPRSATVQYYVFGMSRSIEIEF